ANFTQHAETCWKSVPHTAAAVPKIAKAASCRRQPVDLRPTVIERLIPPALQAERRARRKSAGTIIDSSTAAGVSEHFGVKRIRLYGAGRTGINIKRCAIMKRRNADCGKIRRPIKKNKIAEQIGSIGYPVVTLGFGFKSYVGYRIRQRKQREVAKDNDFYMQLLQEALPKEESIATIEPSTDGAAGGGDHSTQKELVPVAIPNNNSLNNSSSSTTSSRSDTGQHHHHHHNHNHHHHNHQQQPQQQQQHSKNAQSYKSSSNSTVSSTHVNGHVSSGSSPSSSSSTMNGGLNHSSHQQQQQNSSKHRKSLDKDSGGSSNASSNASNTLNSGSKMNGGSSGVGGNYSFHQTTTFQQNSGSNVTSNGSTTNTNSGSNNSGSASSNSTKESSTTVSRTNDHNGPTVAGSIHCNGGTVSKDSKDAVSVTGLSARKDHDKEATGSSSSSNSSSSSSSSTKHGSGQMTVAATNRSKSPTECGTTLGNKTIATGKQNGHVSHHQQTEPAQQQQVPTETTPVATESKGGGGGGRSGRKNRIKKAAEQQANLSAIAKLCATLALASSVTTFTTTTATASASSGTDKGTATVTSPSYTGSGSVSSASAKDNHQHNDEQQPQDAADGTGGSNTGKGGGGGGGAGENQPSSNASSPPVATVLVQKVCEACPRFEGELKKLRSELASHRQTENELRQKYDSSTSNLKACMQAKQKEYDELHSRYQEHSSQRQQERQNLQTVERRLGEERRHRQSLEAQLNNERKYRKQAEEKAARAECGEVCKSKKQQMELEFEKMQHELLGMEETKLMAEKQARNYEQEMRKMELQIRSREAQQNTEVLMSALAAMQDKNATLEKNLSAETRVKLDLFSALGGTRREVEILTCSLRSKEKEILDLNAKIVQLVAVMPTMPNDALCLTGHSGGTGADGGGASMMRLADAPQLLPQSLTSGVHLNGVGGGPGGGGAGVVGVQQQSSPMSHLVQNGPPTFCGQLGSLGVLTSTMTTLAVPSASSGGPNSANNGCGVHLSSAGAAAVVAAAAAAASGGQIVQMQNVNSGGGGGGLGSANNCPGSGLDPNATIYTPKNNGMELSLFPPTSSNVSFTSPPSSSPSSSFSTSFMSSNSNSNSSSSNSTATATTTNSCNLISASVSNMAQQFNAHHHTQHSVGVSAANSLLSPSHSASSLLLSNHPVHHHLHNHQHHHQQQQQQQQYQQQQQQQHRHQSNDPGVRRNQTPQKPPSWAVVRETLRNARDSATN
uniref:Uncharacterized protein n=1 Tax=Anopheles dirus TaxID=7168 RepID=A0A182MYH0_9DIPT